MKTTLLKYKYLIIIFIFISLKYIETAATYSLGGDGPWSLSQTLSMLNGDWGWSKFAHEPDGQIYKNYTYAFLFYVPFKIFGVSHFSYLTTYFGYLALAVFGVFKIFKNFEFLQFFLSIILLSSVYTYDFRFETITISLIIWGFYFLFQNKNYSHFIAFFLLAWASLIHPAGFIAVFFSIFHYLYLSHKLKNIKLISIYLAIFIFFSLLILGFDYKNLLDPIFIRPELKQRFFVIKPLNFLKWLVLAGVFIWGLIFSFNKKSLISILLITGHIFIYLIFKKSYYYPYLFIHVLIMIYFQKEFFSIKPIFLKFFFVHLVCFGLVFFIFPVYKSYENPDYGKMMRSNIEYLKNLPESDNPTQKNYIERELLMGLATRVNTRLYLKEYSSYYNNSPKIDLKNDDKIYLFHKKRIRRF